MEPIRIPCKCDNGYQKCTWCDGTGTAWTLDGLPLPFSVSPAGSKRVSCPECKGQGKRICPMCGGKGQHTWVIHSNDTDSSSGRVGASREECTICNALGWATCPSCNGTKYVLLIGGHVAGSAQPFERNATLCMTCRGTGAVYCPECDGTGYLNRGHIYGSGRDKPLRSYRP